MRQRARALGVATCIMVVAGCISSGRILERRGTGVVRCYHVSLDAMWTALETAVRETGLVLERSNREGGFLIARSYRPEVEAPEDMALDADQGERVAVFVDREGTDVWAVEIVNRPIFSLDVTPRDWTQSLFFTIEQRLPGSARAENDEVAACTRVHRPADPRGAS